MAKKIHTAIIFLFLLLLIGLALFGSQIIKDFKISIPSLNITQKDMINLSSELSISYLKIQLKNSTILLNSTQSYEINISDSILGIPYGDIKIFNFYGELIIDKDISSIRGNFTKISSGSFNLTRPSSMIVINNKSFSNIEIEDVYLDKLNLKNVSGSLEIPKINITIKNEDIEMNSLQANISYERNVRIKGLCKEIKIGNRLLILGS
jgi:hypothetical protein